MLFDPSTAPQLKPWLVRTLEPICDAEPGALAEYILALLKHNVPESEMRKELTSQLDEFLEKECSSFIDTLFTVLRTKSYLPYNTIESIPTQPRAMDSSIPIPHDPYASPTRGVKRSMENDELDGRPPKGPRLSGDGSYGRQGQWGGRGGMNGGSRMGMGMGGPMDMNGQMNGRKFQAYQPPEQAKRGYCRDYHNNGYCARGATCKYSHGDEAVVPGQLYPMDGSQGMPGMGGPHQMPYMGMFPNGGMPFGMGGGDAYDPNSAQMDMRPMPGNMAGMGPGGMGGRSRVPLIRRAQDDNGGPSEIKHNPNASGELPVIQDLTPQDLTDASQSHSQSQTQFQNGYNGGYGTPGGMPNMPMEVDDTGGPPMQGGFRGGMRGGGRGGRGSHNGNNSDNHMRPQKGGRSDKTLVVEKIPEDKLSIDSITGWFKRFGTVTNVAVDPRGGKALVTFAEHEEARTAWKSEDAVFNNRFVKLFWHRPMEGHGQGGAKALAASASLVANINGKDQAAPAAAQPVPPTIAARRKPATLATSALAAKQQLLEKQIAEQKSLMAQLGSTTGDEKKEIMARLRKLGEEMKPSPSATPAPSPSPALPVQKQTSFPDDHEQKERERLDKELEGHADGATGEGAGEETTEDLKAKLARLKAEAASLGLPEAASEPPAFQNSYRPYRGRGRAGRSYYRGSTMRGGPPRASMKLDNRPKKLLLRGVSSDGLQAVRDWYETTGHVESVDTVDDGNILVSFKTRSAAEQGFSKGQNIPQVGQVQISWHGNQPSSTSLKEKIGSSTGASKDGTVEEGPAEYPGEDRQPSPRPEEDEEVIASGWGGDGDEDGMGMI